MIGSLFTGYGGLDMAVQAVTGLPLAFVSDIEPGPIAVQAHRHPHVPNLGDVTAIDWTPWRGRVDVLTGGFPCQDVSVAGAQAGLAGARSGLWSEMLRAVTELHPTLVVIENVRGLLSAKTGLSQDVRRVGARGGIRMERTHRAMGAVLGGLADAGYDARWCGLRAADVGACHGRFRVFILAHARDETSRASIANTVRGRRDRRPSEQGRAAQNRTSTNGGSAHIPLGHLPTPRASDAFGAGAHGNGGPDLRTVASTLDDRFGEYAAAVERHTAVLGRPAPAPTERAPRGGRRLSAKFVEWMMMLPEGHVTDVPGLSRNAQLRLLGNGVVPLQAEVALRHPTMRLAATRDGYDGQAGHAGPSDEHTPPRLPGAGVKWSEQITPAGVMPWSDTASFGDKGSRSSRTAWPQEIAAESGATHIGGRSG